MSRIVEFFVDHESTIHKGSCPKAKSMGMAGTVTDVLDWTRMPGARLCDCTQPLSLA